MSSHQEVSMTNGQACPKEKKLISPLETVLVLNHASNKLRKRPHSLVAFDLVGFLIRAYGPTNPLGFEQLPGPRGKMNELKNLKGKKSHDYIVSQQPCV